MSAFRIAYKSADVALCVVFIVVAVSFYSDKALLDDDLAAIVTLGAVGKTGACAGSGRSLYN